MFAHARQRKFLALPFAAVGVLAMLAVAAPATQAAPAPGGLPPIGAEIPFSMLSADTPVTIRGHQYSVDFRGGMRVRVEPNPDDPANSVRLRVTGFRMTGELPSTESTAQPGGTVTLEQDDADVDARSLLRLTQQFPPKYEQIMVLSFAMIIDQPGDQPGPRAAAEPLVLTTREPAKLVGTLSQFPPRGDLYQLQNPVDLVLPDQPDTTIATIAKFPVKVGGL